MSGRNPFTPTFGKVPAAMAAFLRKHPEATRIVVGSSASAAVTVEDFLLGNVMLPCS